jgi:hypothetical protein
LRHGYLDERLILSPDSKAQALFELDAVQPTVWFSNKRNLDLDAHLALAAGMVVLAASVGSVVGDHTDRYFGPFVK